jgi:hypothetical protein
MSFVTKLVNAPAQLASAAIFVLAGAMALSPATDSPTQITRDCVWNGHVVLCRYRDADPPQLAKEHRPQPTPLPPAG